MNLESQNKRILAHLSSGETITPIDALKRFDCFRLAARISDLRTEGHNIRTNYVKEVGGKRYAEYKLIKTK